MTEISILQTIKRWLWRKQESSIIDVDDFACLYDQNYLIVFRYVYGLISGTRQDVEDITAETFMRAWSTRHRFSGDEQAALRWLLRIARNLVIDVSRRKKFRMVDDSVEVEALLDASTVPEDDLVTREQIAILWKMLSSLPATTREMLVLRYMLGWQVKQIAAHLDKTENNISVNIRRALSRLQRDFLQLEGE